MATTPYETWVAEEGVPVLETFAVEDLPAIEVGPWERVGGNGCLVHLEGRGPGNAFVTEIPPGKELNEQRHLFEESVFAVSGSGRTEFWNDKGFRQAFNWEGGAIFAIPLNVHFKHINRSSTEAARLFSISSQPLMMNVLHDLDFVYSCDRDFDDRFNPEITDFTKPAQSAGEAVAKEGENLMSTGLPFVGNLVPSGFDVPLPPSPYRGAGGRLLPLHLSNNNLRGHISEFPSKTYKKAHRHGPGAHVILLTGTGYSLLWRYDDEEPIRVDWHPGSCIVPPDRYFHQHFNTGDDPARYLALYANGGIPGIGNEFTQLVRSTREGGDQIEYEDDSPRIKELFEEEIVKLAKS